MLSTVKSRNHYETLGVAPTASAEEIAQAFGRKMSLLRARPLDSATSVCSAYETLRDPAKRRAYDRSLGLAREPDRRPWAIAAQQRWTPFSASAVARPAPQLARFTASAGEADPHVTAAPEIEEDLDARVASIAASLREVAKPDQRPDAPEPVRHEPAAPAPTQQERDTALNRTIELILNDGRREKQKLRRAKPPVEWNRPLFLVSGLLVAAGFVGAVAGLSVTHNEEAAKADPTVTVGLPAATDHADVAAASAAPDAPAIEQRAELPVLPPTTRRNSQRVSAAEKTAPPPEPQADAPPAPEPGGPASDPLAPQPAAEPMAAALPLPNAVIARTIERIGYKCGTVASTAADAAAPGVFTVTCSSGQSYQATPVHGRYRFRRSGGR